MMTLKQLITSTYNFAEWRMSLEDIKFNKFLLQPQIGTKILLATSRAKSSGKSGNKEYVTLIQFLGVEYEEHEPSDDEHTAIKLLTGPDADASTVYLYDPLDGNKINVQVECSCSDYYFRFAWWNYEHGCHYGRRPRPYVPVKGSNRPPVNPDHIPGMCKHLNSLVETLKYNKIPDFK